MTVDTPAWVRDAIFYQIFPDRFAASERVLKPGRLEPWDAPPTYTGFKGGDLRGITEHLDYLDDLGINALYLTPVFQSASNHRYHTFDYFEVDPLLGGNDALHELLDAAHGRGMRVVLDGVFNHTGRGFWPFHHILETGAMSPYRDWFVLDDGRLDAGLPLVAYPPPDAPQHAEGYEAWWGLPALPKLNTDHPEVREYIFSVGEFWLQRGIDGWRLDVPQEIDDEGFWQEFRRRCRSIRSDAYLVGEIWGVAPDWLRGDRFDAVMNYPLGEAILSLAGGSHLDMDVVRQQSEYAHSIYPHDAAEFQRRVEALSVAYDPDVVAVQLNLLGSHDAPRMRTVLGDTAGVRLATLLQATLPGAPCVYYGDEVGMQGGVDPANRGGFPWDESRWEPGLRDGIRAVLKARGAESALRDGPLRFLWAEGSAVAYERGEGASRFVIAVNAADEAATIHVPIDGDVPPDRPLRLDPVDLPGFGVIGVSAVAGGSATLVLPPRSGGLFRIV
ncbi:MAG: glycoside hydrolase family 13 protein [Chloroflexota bacterium]